MSVRAKTSWLVGGVFSAFIGVSHGVQQYIVLPSFAALEQDDAAANQKRCVEAIGREIELLSYHLSDWSSWNDTYEFMVDLNEEYKLANLVPTMYTNNHINLVCFVDNEARVVWSGAYDLATAEPMTIAAFAGTTVHPHHPLLKQSDLTSAVEGVMITEHGPLLVASRRILNNENEGPPRGTLIMGKLLDAEQVAGIAERTHVDMEVLAIPGAILPQDASDAIAMLVGGAPLVVEEIDQNKTLQLRSTIEGVDGQPALLLTTRIPRDITARGKAAIRIAAISDASAGIAILVLMWIALNKIVVRPLTRLTRHAITVAETDDFSSPIAMQRADEIGILAGEFDRMMLSLAESRKRQAEISHNAGMAEIATGIIHNVGNVLNSVNVSARRAVECIDSSGVSDLNEVVGLIRKHSGNLGTYMSSDEKGRMIPEFLAQLGEDLAGEKKEALKELQSLAKNVDHIAEIVNTQQAYTSVSGAVSRVSLAELIEDAIKINLAAMDRHAVQIIREFEEVPKIMTERHKALQILVNLLSNAKYALDDIPASDRRITIRLLSPKDDAAFVRIEIVDNGVGISRDCFAKLFSYGYTTRANGHGFGLHNSANAAKSIGGRLTAHSAGSGQGAKFVIELPARTSKAVT